MFAPTYQFYVENSCKYWGMNIHLQNIEQAVRSFLFSHNCFMVVDIFDTTFYGGRKPQYDLLLFVLYWGESNLMNIRIITLLMFKRISIRNCISTWVVLWFLHFLLLGKNSLGKCKYCEKGDGFIHLDDTSSSCG